MEAGLKLSSLIEEFRLQFIFLILVFGSMLMVAGEVWFSRLSLCFSDISG